MRRGLRRSMLSVRGVREEGEMVKENLREVGREGRGGGRL